MLDSRIAGTQTNTVRRRTLLATIAAAAAVLSVTGPGVGTAAAAVDSESDMVRAPRRNRAHVLGSQARTAIDLKTLGPEHYVASISLSANGYRVETVSGKVSSFAESDLRFKTDSSAAGPAEGTPVLLPRGMRADRAFVVFANPRDISRFIHQEASL